MIQISIMTIIININIIITTQGIVTIHNGGCGQVQSVTWVFSKGGLTQHSNTADNISLEI